MRLTLQTDFALRLLMHLAVRGEALTTIAASADRHEISKNHLMKVAHNLTQLGYIETVRGRSGGLRLSRPANHINVGSVVREMEGGDALVACFPNGSGHCRITPSCRLKGVLIDAQESFFASLDGYSLQDLVAENVGLETALKT